ncbi:MAG: PilW family protein [Solirubrobacterales bacterium]
MRRLEAASGEGGFTLVELLVASAMGVVVMAAVASLVISAVRGQPKITKQAQNISIARQELDRMTREIRSGVAVDPEHAKANLVSFQGFVRRTSCGSSTVLASGLPAIKCQITYSCTTTSCSRIEANVGTFTGVSQPLISGISSDQVFTYAPAASSAKYVKITLRIPNPSGQGALTVSAGASLRNATLNY